MKHHLSLHIVTAVCLAFMIGCASHQNSDLPAASTPLPNSGDTAQLPGIAGLDALRASAGLSESLIHGAAALETSAGAVSSGSALTLDASDSGPGEGQQSAWAIYGFSTNEIPLDSIHVELQASLEFSAWIGFSNYEDGTWVWKGPLSGAKSFLLDEKTEQGTSVYISPAGTFFCTLMAAPGNIVTVEALSIRSLSPQNQPPTASLDSAVRGGDLPLVVSFDASNSTDPDGQIIEYAWDWQNDGVYDGFSDQPTASYTFTSPGLQTVRMRVTDNNFARAADTVSIDVSTAGNARPNCDLVPANASGFAPLLVNFSAGGSDAGCDPGDYIALYEWDWDGDDSYDSYGTLSDASHTYMLPGSFSAKLRISDSLGRQAVASCTISVNIPGNEAPVANLQSDKTGGDIPLSVEFDAAGSQDADGPLARYDYDLDGDGVYEVFDADSSIVHIYESPGAYDVKVRVTDAAGVQDSDTVSINVTQPGNEPPFADFQANPLFGPAPLLVDFDASASSTGGDPGDSIVLYEWDWNWDFVYDSYSASPLASHEFTTAGSPIVLLRITDEAGNQHVNSISLYCGSVPVTPDSDGDVGGGTSLADINGKPAMSYYDLANHDLRYVQALDAEGSSWGVPQTLDSAGDTGAASALLQVNGKPAICYSDLTNTSLRYIQALDPDGLSWGAPVTIATSAASNADTCMQVINGSPAIAYYQVSSEDLMYTRSLDPDGAAWPAPVTLDSTGTTGTGASLAVVNGVPAIAFYKNSGGDLRYVHALDIDGATWAAPMTLDSDNETGHGASLAIVEGMPAISYYRFFPSTLFFIRAADPAGDTWGTRVAVTGSERAGGPTSLTIVDGRPAIAYFGIKYAILCYSQAVDNVGAAWSAPRVIDSRASTGYYCSMKLINGAPAVSYYDYLNTDLRYVTGF